MAAGRWLAVVPEDADARQILARIEEQLLSRQQIHMEEPGPAKGEPTATTRPAGEDRPRRWLPASDRVGCKFLLKWVLANTVGGTVVGAVGLALSFVGSIVGGEGGDSVLWAVGLALLTVGWVVLALGWVVLALGGAIVGTAQWIVLRRRVYRFSGWVLASAAGWVVGWVVGLPVGGVMFGAVAVGLAEGGALELLAGLAVVGAVVGAMVGAMVGMAQ